MILWKDFLLDDVCGPILVSCEGGGGSRSIMDDANVEISIQETRQEHRPARMVGTSGLESTLMGMEALPSTQSSTQPGGSA